MGSSRKWWVVLGVLACAFVVLSLPTRAVEPDVDTAREALFRVLPGGNWELWHGPTRNNQVQIVVGTVALETEQDPWVGAGPAETGLRGAITELRARLAPALDAGLRHTRIEIPAGLPLRFALRVAQAASLEGLTTFEIATARTEAGTMVGIAQAPAQIRRTDLHPDDPALARLVLTRDENAMSVTLEGMAAYPVGPAQGDFLPEGSRIKWGFPRETSDGRWLFIGYDIADWQNPFAQGGGPQIVSPLLQGALAKPLGHIYLELPDFNVNCSWTLRILRYLADASGTIPEYLVEGFDFENALGGN